MKPVPKTKARCKLPWIQLDSPLLRCRAGCVGLLGVQGAPSSAMHKTFVSVRRVLLFLAVLAVTVISLSAADLPELLPLDQVKPGMVGQARTIFEGNQIETFDLVVIGILPNLLGPKQSVILVQLKGDKVQHTGVVAGMSGSPVYIGGKLVGALSLKFGVFTKEPLAGVTPIADMLSLPIGNPLPAAGAPTSTASAPRASAGSAVEMAAA